MAPPETAARRPLRAWARAGADSRSPGYAAEGGMAQRMIEANGVELCAEAFGDPRDPPILLIMGIGASAVVGGGLLRDARRRWALRDPLSP